jgi:hypothetical protein
MTPDALVYLNGDLSIPGCPTCGGKIDLQQYITEVSVDPTTQGPATASFSLHLPKHSGDAIFRDGNPLLRPSLEVHIYMRGYFPVEGILADTPPEMTGGVDLTTSIQYPYYMVFHGVITEVNHEYSGGEHTASVSCVDLLHFWQYQRMSTDGSLFGSRPTNSKVHMSLVGHNLTGMSPYSICYMLFRDVMGSAGGVEFALGSQTNAAANSTVVGESLFSMSILYWQQRFSQTTTSLRMYGVDGTLYNAFQQSFLASLKQSDPDKMAKLFADVTTQSHELDPLLKTARLVGFDPYTLFASAASEKDAKNDKFGINTLQIQAFVSDIGNWGNVNLFESKYQTKTEIMTTVKEAVGFEFYQDVDGDFVFKPPFYNMDTSTSRAYRIEPIDIISFSVSEKEPEATVVKATGSWFKNLKVPGIEGEWGTRAEFIDYRLVAQYGWRQATFETSYHTDPRAMFFACVSRFDLFNIAVKSASCTIPIRPELRPGYPVYIAHLDCFYYVQSFAHSFAFGGQCTTNLNLVGRRAKFYAPGKPSLDGSPAKIGDIYLNNPHLPQIPLQVVGNDGIPRLQGFPNVVMTLDPEQINPLTYARGIDLNDLTTEEAIQGIIDRVLYARNGILVLDENATTQLDPKIRARKGPFKIQTGNGEYIPLPSISELLVQVNQKIAASAKKDKATEEAIQDEVSPLLLLVEAAKDASEKAFPEAGSSAAYLDLLNDLKAAYNPGKSLPGYYRYYSSSHPDPEMQGTRAISLDEKTGQLKVASLHKINAVGNIQTLGFSKDGGNTLVPITPVGGIPIPIPGSSDILVAPTHLITSFQIAKFEVFQQGDRYVTLGSRPQGYPDDALAAELKIPIFNTFAAYDLSPDSPVSDLFPVFNQYVSDFRVILGDKYSPENIYQDELVSDIQGNTQTDQLRFIALTWAKALASAASALLITDTTETGAGKWASLFPTGVKTQSSRAGDKRANVKVEQKQTHYVPVFPVSDEKGYEVIGTYRYGRALSIAPGGNFHELNQRSRSDNTTFDKVEDFIHSLGAKTDYSAAVKTLDPALQAELASQSLTPDIIAGATDGTQVDAGGLNNQANSRETTQKIAITNVAYSLADMDIQGRHGVCSCKGAEADMLLAAYGQEYLQVGVGDTAEVQNWLSDQMVKSVGDWSSRQAAYRGEVIDSTYSDAGDAISKLNALGKSITRG